MRDVTVTAYSDASIEVSYLLPLDADGAAVCYRVAAAPAKRTCADARPEFAKWDGSAHWNGTDGTTYDVDVRAYSSKTHLYGPAVHATITARDTSPQPPIVTIAAAGPTSLRVSGELSNSDGLADGPYSLWFAYLAGTQAPPADAPLVALRGGLVTGLQPDAPYTFAVYLKDNTGHTSVPTVRTVTTRQAGVYVATPTVPSALVPTGRTSADNPDVTNPTSLQVDRAGVVHAVYQSEWNSYYSWRTTAGTWQATVPIAPDADGGVSVTSPHLAAAPDGAIAVVYAGNRGLRFRWLRANHTFGPSLAIVSDATDIASVVIDKHHRLHLTVTDSRGRNSWYVTNAGGTWHSTPLPQALPSGISGILSYDAAADRVAVVIDRSTTDPSSHDTVYETLVAMPAATSTALGPVASWTTGPDLVDATASQGRLTITLTDDTILTGTADGPDGPPQPMVVGGEPAGFAAIVATSATTVIADYARASPTWDPTQQGIWQSVGTYDALADSWAWSTPRQISTSAFDRPMAAVVGSDGLTWDAFWRVSYDPIEMSG